MYEDFIIFIFITTFFTIHLLTGCKKKTKNNTVKSMASDKSKQKPVVHTPPTNSGPSGGELEKKKAPKANEPQMAARDANDNETINDAKSDWGELPA